MTVVITAFERSPDGGLAGAVGEVHGSEVGRGACAASSLRLGYAAAEPDDVPARVAEPDHAHLPD
jgi:hypothetical protein